ncbi:MAG: 2-oxo acid dehydrogenase subunit E2 [Planctomycetes bacterium]|nr:2-oxo acid dehydrogenase subunit E2 [Planctomycetota bacterium]
MATKILLPKFGQTVETSEITQWLATEGAVVKKGDILCEIATDKSSLEVESPYDGTLLRILLAPAVTAPVGCVMAVIGEPGEKLDDAFIAACISTQRVSGETASAPAVAASASAPAVAPPIPRRVEVAAVSAAPVAAPAAANTSGNGRVFISPRARRLATTSDVPVAILDGSGENGRITEADVRGYLDAIGPVTPAARTAALQKGVDLRGVKGSGPSGRIMLEDLAACLARVTPTAPANAPAKKTRAPLPALVAKLEKPGPMRRAIAANMSASAATIPSFQLEVSVDASAMIARRDAEKTSGSKVGFGDIIAKACALAVRRFPMFAAQWGDAGIRFFDRVHIGFAVAIPGGLIVPVVHDCDQAAIRDIAVCSAQLVEKARAGKLAPEEYSGAVFTLSNLGAFPVDRFVAIVPPGQSGILAIGRIRDELVARGGGFFPAKVMSLTLSADHRYIDGADGARFMQEVKELLEDAASI